MTDTIRSYFQTVVENLGIISKFMSEEPVDNESVTDIIKKFENHPSLIKINENHQERFSFSAVDMEIDSFDASKTF